MSQTGIKMKRDSSALFPVLSRSNTRATRISLRRLAPIVFTLVFLICAASNALPPVRPGQTAAVPSVSEARFLSSEVHGTWSHFKLPDGAVDLALKSRGAWATASSTAAQFDPNGAIDGNWTAQGWGKGHGWQSANRHEYPSWLEIHLPREEEIDTIVIQTFPEVMQGINWMGIRNVDVQVKYNSKLEMVGGATSVRANIKGYIVLPVPLMLKTDTVRVRILGVNTGNQEDVVYDDDDFARILQVGLYHIGSPFPFTSEELHVQVERGPRGSVAIYRDDLPVKPANPSSPDYLATVFRQAGYGVTFLDSKALCLPEIFSRENFDVFVDPYGAPFPVETMLYDFLSSGGHLITMGGHPFKQALMFSPEAKLADGGYDPGITTTVARQADYKVPFREQLGMFYTGYERFEDVAFVKPAPDQNIVATPFKVNAHLEGEVAAGYVGERLSLKDGERLTKEGTFPAYANTTRKNFANVFGVLNGVPSGANFNYMSGYIFNWPRARWIPLVNAYDYAGRLRGSVVSLLANFRGPYRGSGWIFCGVENEDLFSPQHPEFTRTLLEALRHLGTGLGLHDALPEMDCYYQGEIARIAATVENYEPKPRHVAADFQLIPAGATSPIFEKRVEIDLAPGANRRPSIDWKPAHFDSDFYLIRATLYEGNREIDSAESAFVVWDPKIIAQGPKVDFRDNYFHVGGRSQLLVGNRTNGFQPHGQVDEDVLGMDRQYAEMHDYGMKVFSPIFFSIYIPGLAWGGPQTPAIPAQLQRLMDAQAQLAQKHHLIFAPDVFFFSKYWAMEQPEFSRRICAELGKRYASVPGIMFYIFDDGGANTPVQTFHDWARKCVEGFSSSGRNYLVFAETDGVAMERYGSEPLAMPANGNYSPGHPALYRHRDMRAAGKSFHLSEFGVNSPGARPSDIDLHTYPGQNVSGSPTGDYSVYLMEPHLLFATGGSYVVNWVWKDTAHLIFPWGVTNPNDYTPAKELIAYRNESFFLRHFRPEFHLPNVLVVFSKERLLRNEEAFTPYLHGVLNELFERAVQFAVIDDVDVDRLPAGPLVLVYPDPRCVSPEVMRKLQSRVEGGDALFVSGDFTQPVEAGGHRQVEWFKQLAGVSWISDYAPGNEIPVVPTGSVGLMNPYIGRPISRFHAEQAEVLATDPEGHALVTTFRVGRGQVFFTSDAGLDGTNRALDAFLALRAVPSTALSPKRANRYIFEIDRDDGGKVYTLAATNPDTEGYTVNGPWIKGPESYDLALANAHVRLPLGTYGVSLLGVRGNGSLDALEGQGKFSVDGDTLLEAEPHVMAMSLDDAALNKSHAIALFVLAPGRVSIASADDVDTVEVGDPEEGEFHKIEEIKTSRSDGRVSFQLDDGQARGVVLITSKPDQDHALQLMNAALQ